MLPLLLVLACAGSIAPYDEAKEPERRATLETSLRTELGATYDQPVPGLDAADLALGKEVWYKNCDACHGAHGQGDGPRAVRMKPRPTNFLVGQQLSDAGELQVIREGSPGTGMPAFGRGLPDHHLVAVYRYLQWLRAHPPAPEDE
ncbi:MAG: c-type cytochrome [Alphaproteobacteria bacterium]|nr:c-type cytochrome [Alphaproteobacteria bacterium]